MSLFTAKPAEIPGSWLSEWVEGIIQSFWKAGRDRSTEAPGSIRGKNYGWVNKAKEKYLFSPFLLVKEKSPNSFICLNEGPLKGHGHRLVGWDWAGFFAGTVHRFVCSKCAQPLNLQQWHLLQGFLISLWRNCSWFSSEVNLPLYLSMYKLNTCVFAFLLFSLKTDSNVSLSFNRKHSTHYL